MQGAEHEIVFHRLIEEEAAAFGRDRRQAAGDAVGRQRRDILVADADRAAAVLHHAHDRAQHRGLAGAVRAEQSDRLAGPTRKAMSRTTSNRP